MTIELKVHDMACDVCANSITQAILALDTLALVTADTNTKKVIVETKASESSVKKAISEAGYHPT